MEIRTISTSSTTRICRLCCKEDSNAIQLYQRGSESWDRVVKSICGYLHLECSNEDMMPKWLCGACQTEAHGSNIYLLKVHKAQQKYLAGRVDGDNKGTLPAKDGVSDEQQKSNNPILSQHRAQRTKRTPKRLIEEINYTRGKRQVRIHPNVMGMATQPMVETNNTAGPNMNERKSGAASNRENQPTLHFPCQLCKQTFTNHTSLQQHLETHKKSRQECTPIFQTLTSNTRFERQQQSPQIGINVRANSLANSPAKFATYVQNAARVLDEGATNVAAHQTDNFIEKQNCLVPVQKNAGVNVSTLPYLQCEKSLNTNSEYKYSQYTVDFTNNNTNHQEVIKPIEQQRFKCEVCEKTFLSHFNFVAHKQLHIQLSRSILERSNKLNTRQLTNDKRSTSVELATTTAAILQPTVNLSPQFAPPQQSLLRRNVDQAVANRMAMRIPNEHLPKMPVITSVEILHPYTPSMKTTIMTDVPPITPQIPPTTPVETPQYTVYIAPNDNLAKYKFQCSSCQKLFKSKSAMTKHLRTHTGDMPYKCSLCPKSFADATNYKRHCTKHRTASENDMNVNTTLCPASMSGLNSLVISNDHHGQELLGRAITMPSHASNRTVSLPPFANIKKPAGNEQMNN